MGARIFADDDGQTFPVGCRDGCDAGLHLRTFGAGAVCPPRGKKAGAVAVRDRMKKDIKGKGAFKGIALRAPF